MNKHILKLLLLTLLVCPATYAQLKTNQALYQTVNGAGSQQAFAKKLHVASSGTLAADPISSIHAGLQPALLPQHVFTIFYGVPIYVGLDRYNLLRAVDQQVSDKISIINYWRGRVSEPGVSKIIEVHQKDLNRLNQIYDEIYARTISPFHTVKPTVTAELRYYAPIGNRLGFIRANNGQVNFSAMYNNVGFDEIYRQPVSGTFIIYKK